ncbi:alanine racemase [Pontibacter sp. E15-1]|uniref:alanine racemase n=1 Tax=Pontibacter sp. E15-1 TaxID=2919918 RepID=UPI001F5003DE|nr:alanine racemase [Pontibacter sp. E15-1]MCJ8166314.1 alanine racemase [Pontibacter sp. E15-1]
MHHSSYIELSKSALQQNISFIRQQVGPEVRISSVIKGNAYGHGIEVFAPLAQACGIDHFSVFSADEAQRLLEALPAPTTIMIMGYLDFPELEWAIKNGIEFFVFDLQRLSEAARVAARIGMPAKVHIEMETGMNRTGFEALMLDQVEKLLRDAGQSVLLQGLCTHFAGAESYQNHNRVMTQLDRFDAMRQRFLKNGFRPKQLHTACSAAMMQYPQTHLDMVRVGIMQYGFWPSPETYSSYMSREPHIPDPLSRLINWKSSIMSLKHVAQGDYVGYGTSYNAPRDMLLAVVPVGYAWGYSRSLSNQGQVLIRGHKVGVVGMVNMNGMMVDVTDIPQVQQGDEVVLLGKQGEHSITVASFAELSTQLNYELLTRLPLNIPRCVVP